MTPLGQQSDAPSLRSTLGFVAGGTALSYPIGLAIGIPWLLPILNALPAYVVLVQRLRRGDRRGAASSMLFWALCLAVLGTMTFSLWPSPVDARIIHGAEYRDEMLHWIRTGEGSEGSPRLFLPQHLAHLGAFCLLSLATASSVSIVMGAILMNYMAFYVAALSHVGAPAWTVLLLGWQPWALCRIAAFCLLGASLAEPALGVLLRRPPWSWSSSRPYLAAAFVGLLADWGLKALLAPYWGLWLRGFLCE